MPISATAKAPAASGTGNSQPPLVDQKPLRHVRHDRHDDEIRGNRGRGERTAEAERDKDATERLGKYGDPTPRRHRA